MKPLTQCPSCQSVFKQVNHNVAWWEEYCNNCDLHYHQYFPKSFQDEELKYITFYTKRFSVYVYLIGDNIFPANEAHVYHRVFPRDQSTQMPMCRFKSLPFDFNHLDQLDEKLQTLSLFK